MEYEDTTVTSKTRPLDSDGEPVSGLVGAGVCLELAGFYLGWSLACLDEGRVNDWVKEQCKLSIGKAIGSLAALAYTLARIAEQEEPPQ